MPLKYVCAETFCFNKQKCIIIQRRRLKFKQSLRLHNFALKKCFLLTYSELPSISLCLYQIKMHCSKVEIPIKSKLACSMNHQKKSIGLLFQDNKNSTNKKKFLSTLSLALDLVKVNFKTHNFIYAIFYRVQCVYEYSAHLHFTTLPDYSAYGECYLPSIVHRQ